MSYSQQRKRLEVDTRVLGGPKPQKDFFPSNEVILPRFGLTGKVVILMFLNEEYTNIPNKILDNLYRYTGEELKIMIFVYRYVFSEVDAATNKLTLETLYEGARLERNVARASVKSLRSKLKDDAELSDLFELLAKVDIAL